MMEESARQYLPKTGGLFQFNSDISTHLPINAGRKDDLPKNAFRRVGQMAELTYTTQSALNSLPKFVYT